MNSDTVTVSTAVPTIAQAQQGMGWARQIYARMLGGWVSDLLVLRQGQRGNSIDGVDRFKKAA